jgi:uncharacterized protein YegP (UPF0339 family)
VSTITPRCEVYPDRSGQWRWRLRARNGRLLADSAESYTRKRDAERAARVALATARDAYVLALDPDADDKS